MTVGKLETEMGKVQSRKPEFQDRDNQRRYQDEVLRPWLRTSRESEELLRSTVK